MQEQLNEKISLLVDDELDGDKALELLQALRHDRDLKAKLQRYQLISQVLKNDECYPLADDFVDNIHLRLRQEPTYFIPAAERKPQRRVTAGWAAAASLLLAAAWLVAQNERAGGLLLPPQMAMSKPEPVQSAVMQARITDYLQAHDNDVYVNQAGRAQPYARLAGYRRD